MPFFLFRKSSEGKRQIPFFISSSNVKKKRNRSYIEHGGSRGYDVLLPLAKRLIRPLKCVLDGEMVVYNAATKRIEPVRGVCDEVETRFFSSRGLG